MTNIADSVGYKNVISSVAKVFGENILSEVKSNVQLIRDNDFNTKFYFGKTEISLRVIGTKDSPLEDPKDHYEYVGGVFEINIPSIDKAVTKDGFISFTKWTDFLVDKKDKEFFRPFHLMLGKDLDLITHGLKILKKYLTHNFLYLQSKAKIETALQNVSEMNQLIDSEWKGQTFKEYLNQYQELEERVNEFIKILEQGDALLEEYEKENGPIQSKNLDLTNAVIANANQVRNLLDTAEAEKALIEIEATGSAKIFKAGDVRSILEGKEKTDVS